MSRTVVTVSDLSKRYQLGEVHTDLLSERLGRGMRSILGRLRGTPARSSEKGNREGTIWALRNVSAEVKEGEVVGIIGRNGAGKSTLLKILSRITLPTEGKVEIVGRLASLLEVGTGFHPELTGHENIFLNGAILGMSKREIRKRFDEIVAFAEVEQFINTPVKRYSSGMYVRLAFAVAAHLNPEILLVDEVLAVGDAAFQKKCLGKMEDVAQGGRTVFFVSHNMASIQRLCSRCILLEQGKLAVDGPSGEVVHRYLAGATDTRGIGEDGRFAFDHQSSEQDYRLLDIKLTDANGTAVRQMVPFGDYALEISFYSSHKLENGSVCLLVLNRMGDVVLRFATRPDSGIDMAFRPGANRVRLRIRRVPLPGGRYQVSVGLAMPLREWLLKPVEVGSLIVQDTDVFKSGFPPTQDSQIAIAEHSWELIG